MINLFDTHTHFDVDEFDHDREMLAQHAYQQGVKALILIGFIAPRFKDLLATQHALAALAHAPKSYLAPGLHPFYIEQHLNQHLFELEQFLKVHSCIAIGEIGLDRYEQRHKSIEMQSLQAQFFSEQLALAKQFDLPVLLHIRKAHGETLQCLKQHKFKQGGIAHAFSGGVEEAKAFVKLGFKIGITGQITNPNAKRLHQVVNSLALEDLVLETDCPDMTPLCCQLSTEHRTRNTPANLPYVLEGLSQVLQIDQEKLAAQLWHNTMQCLNLTASEHLGM